MKHTAFHITILQTRESDLSAFFPALQKGHLVLNPFSVTFPRCLKNVLAVNRNVN